MKPASDRHPPDHPHVVEPELELAGHPAAMRVLVFTEHFNATCYISFERPLRALHGQGKANFAVASQNQVKAGGEGCWRRWMTRMQPDVVVLSRYAQPYGDSILQDARRMGAAVVYHIDDNLLELPDSLSAGVVQVHGAAEVVNARASMLQQCDLIYASTANLASVLRARFPEQRITHGDIYCSYQALESPVPVGPPVVGYMGSRGHQEDLALVVPALKQLLMDQPTLRFEVFGSIQMPGELALFGDRVRAHSVQKAYPEFLQTLAGLGWSIGLAPLVDEPFNRCKAPTKFIEYTSAGIPCVASRRPVYGEVVPRNGGALVDDQWYTTLSEWMERPDLARSALMEARKHCAVNFPLDRLAHQVQIILANAAASVSATAVLVPRADHHPLAAAVLRDWLARASGQRVRVRDAGHAPTATGLAVHKLQEWPVALAAPDQRPSPHRGLDLLGLSLRTLQDPQDSPWRARQHPLSPAWTAALQTMLNEGDFAQDDIRLAISRGEVRPSLMNELSLGVGSRSLRHRLNSVFASASDRLHGFKRSSQAASR